MKKPHLSKSVEGIEIDAQEELDDHLTAEEFLELQKQPEWLIRAYENRQLIGIIMSFSIVFGTLFSKDIIESINKLRYLPPIFGKTWRTEKGYANKVQKRAKERDQYINSLKGKKTEEIDKISFYAKKDYYEGKIEKKEIQPCINKLREHLKRYQRQKNAMSIQENIHDMINNQGQYLEYMSGVCHVALKNRSNCNSRSMYMYLMTHGTYGKQLKGQWNGTGMHREYFIKLNGIWHATQKPGLTPLKKKDFDRTTTTASDADIKAFRGEKVIKTFHMPPRRPGEKRKEIKTIKKFKKGGSLSVDSFSEFLKHNLVPGHMRPNNSFESKVDQKTSFKDAEKRRKENLEKVIKADRLRNPLKIKFLNKKEFQKLYDKAVGKNLTQEDIKQAKKVGKINLSGRPVEDLSKLKGLALNEVILNRTKVKDLNTLKGMPLKYLDISNTKIKSLLPIKDSPLLSIRLNSYIKDLSGFPLLILNYYNDSIKNIPKDHFINLKTMQIVRLRDGQHKKELMQSNERYYYEVIKRYQSVKKSQAGIAKMNSGRECIEFKTTENPFKKRKVCITNSNEIIGYDPTNNTYNHIKLYRNKIWEIHYLRSRFGGRIKGYGATKKIFGEVKWSRLPIRKLQNIKIEEAGAAKKGTDRECLSFYRNERGVKIRKKVCLGDKDISESRINRIELLKEKSGIWKIEYQRRMVVWIRYPIGKVRWSKKERSSKKKSH